MVWATEHSVRQLRYPPVDMSTCCVFCGGPLGKARAKEHVFPEWIQRHFGLADEGVLLTHFSSTGDVISDRFHAVHAHSYGRVCFSCNAGWMSRLEEAAKPLVTGLAEGRLGLRALQDSEYLTLGRWACKTAYIIHAASNYRPIVKPEHYHDLRTKPDGLPAGVHVFAYQHRGAEPFSIWQTTEWWVDVADESPMAALESVLRDNAYKIAFSIRGLALVVIFNPVSLLRLVLWKGVHFPVFPGHGPVYWYEKSGFPDDDADSVCIGLMAAMGLRQYVDRTADDSQPCGGGRS